MSKPLELKVYEHFEHNEICYANLDGIGEVNVDYWIQCKRLSDAELAAEYWRLRLKVCSSGNRDMKAVGHVCVNWQAAHDELDIMQRFMELPHYDEAS
ncbi:hypothetical protein [Arthrobacter sp. SD76]|uniref:hypothetical protein n=1 Tax=Arthrobacter sp. SD76 TaxID=3415007 RepID=UPI003C7545E2